MKRREFLSLCVAGSLSAMLSACQGEHSPTQVSKAKPRPTKQQVIPTSQSSPTVQPSPGPPNWSELAATLQGKLVRPDNPAYPTARQLFNPRFDNVFPMAIAYCVSPADVAACLAFARRFRLPLTARSGGHSYGGYSTTKGLVVDVTPMSSIVVDTNTRSVTVGAGARLIDVYAALAPYGLALPAGTCPTVGITGLTLGGGVGVLGRKWGLTCDNLLAAHVVIADGSIVTCDAYHDSDLFWALRGGGGGNFGVITSLRFRVHPLNTLSLFTLTWPWSAAATVVDAWQRWAPFAPDEVWSGCILQATADPQSDPIIQVYGVSTSGMSALDALIGQLADAIGVAPLSRSLWEADPLAAMLHEANCSGKTVGECHLPNQHPQGLLLRSTYKAKSDYFTRLLPREGVEQLVQAISRSQASPVFGFGGVGLDAFGGAINRVAADATAFVHRDALFSAQYAATWSADADAYTVEANFSWLNEMWRGMRPYASGGAYQNYIDPDLPQWQDAYYGSNLPRLQRVKAAYDPANLLHFAQSIPPMSGPSRIVPRP